MKSRTGDGQPPNSQGLAIVLVYMVLAGQFNSFIQPLFIMVAQPLAIIGGVFGLWLMNH